MSDHFSFVSHSMRRFAVIVLALSAVATLHGQDAMAPTASQDPAVIDQIWQSEQQI
jgi:hypothetical protein